MATAYVGVDVEVDLAEFVTDDLVDELVQRGNVDELLIELAQRGKINLPKPLVALLSYAIKHGSISWEQELESATSHLI